LLEEGADINAAFAEKIEAKIVDLETGDYVENINANEYDQRKAAKRSCAKCPIPKEKICPYQNKSQICQSLFGERSALSNRLFCLSTVWIWSTLYGFLSLDLMAKPCKVSTSMIRLKHQAWRRSC